MNLDTFIITCFCLIDDLIPRVTDGQRLRQWGPLPKLTDSEVITMEVVGTYLGVTQDQELYAVSMSLQGKACSGGLCHLSRRIRTLTEARRLCASAIALASGNACVARSVRT